MPHGQIGTSGQAQNYGCSARVRRLRKPAAVSTGSSKLHQFVLIWHASVPSSMLATETVAPESYHRGPVHPAQQWHERRGS